MCKEDLFPDKLKKENQNANGGTELAGATTLAACKTACNKLSIDVCASFDWDESVKKRWYHAKGYESKLKAASGVTNYGREACTVASPTPTGGMVFLPSIWSLIKLILNLVPVKLCR